MTEHTPHLQNWVDELARCEARLTAAQDAIADALSLVRDIRGGAHAPKQTLSIDEMTRLLSEFRGGDDIVPAPAGRREQASGDTRNELVLDREGKVARLGRRKVPLTETEYQVLELLWLSGPEPISREAIIESVYAGKQKPGPRSVDVYVFHLRQKLKISSGGMDFIQVVRGKGWKLAVGTFHAGPA